LLLINEIISTILQIVIFTAIPFFVYLIAHRRIKGFFDYIGLRKPKARTMIYALGCAVAFVLPALLLVFFSPKRSTSGELANCLVKANLTGFSIAYR